MDCLKLGNAADGKKTEGSNVAFQDGVCGKSVNSDFVDPEGNVLNKHHGLLHPFEHAPTIHFEGTGSITVVDVPLVSEPTRRDEVLAPVQNIVENEAVGVQDDSPGLQNNQPVQGQVISVRRSKRKRNQPIYNEQLLANRLLRRAPVNMMRASNRQETLREPIHNEQLLTDRLPRRVPVNMMRAPIRR